MASNSTSKGAAEELTPPQTLPDARAPHGMTHAGSGAAIRADHGGGGGGGPGPPSIPARAHRHRWLRTKRGRWGCESERGGRGAERGAASARKGRCEVSEGRSMRAGEGEARVSTSARASASTSVSTQTHTHTHTLSLSQTHTDAVTHSPWLMAVTSTSEDRVPITIYLSIMSTDCILGMATYR